MLELGTIGPKFTLTNKRMGKAHIKERLDKAIGNVAGRICFAEAVFPILTAGGSDHSPILPWLLRRRDWGSPSPCPVPGIWTTTATIQ